MPSTSFIPIQVYPVTKEWEFEETTTGLTGTRVYYYFKGNDAPPNETPVDLPKLGDAWDDDYTTVTLKSIRKTYLDENPNCPDVYTCAYDGLPYMESVTPLTPDELPKSMAISGENIVWEPETGGIANGVWNGLNGQSEDRVDQPIYKPIGHVSITWPRIIKNFKTYVALVAKCANKVNSEEFFGFPSGTVLFNGGQSEQYKNKRGQDRWRIALNFDVRCIFDDDGELYADTWQLSLRKDTGGWDVPLVDGKYPLHQADLNELFESDPLDDQDDLYTELPSE